MKKWFSALLCGILTLGAVGADLVNLDLNFASNNYLEVLKKVSGVNGYEVVDGENGAKALQLKSGTIMNTPVMPYFEGDITIDFDVRCDEITRGEQGWDVALFQVYFYQGEKGMSHKDFYTNSKDAAWKHYSITLDRPSKNINGFQVSFGNRGKGGNVEIANVRIRVVTEGKEICGDTVFKRTLGLDHWYPQSQGSDWDDMPLYNPAGKTELIDNGLPYDGKTLHLTNGQTVKSARLAYDGEALICSVWMKSKGIKKGANRPGWATAALQLVMLDDAGQVVGHRDVTPLILTKDNEEFQLFALSYPEGNLSRKVKWLELYLRIFDGAEGEMWYANPSLVLFPNELDRKPFNPVEGTVKVELSKAEKEVISPVWEGTDAWMSSVMGIPTVREAMRRFRDGGNEHLRIREFMQGWGLYKGLDEAGEPILNFEDIDEFMDYLVKDLGFKMTLTIESTPNEIASRPGSNPKAFRNTSTPTDIPLWGKITQRLVEHWVDRYGKDTVESWIFECWNEPRATSFFSGTEAEFMQIFNAYMDALLAAEKSRDVKLQIGTPSDVGMSSFFNMIFEENKKNPGRDARLDIISMHIYGGYSNSVDVYDRSLKGIMRLRDQHEMIKGKPVIITEYGGDSMPNKFHDGREAAAFNVRVNRVFLDNNVLRGYYFCLVDFPWPGNTPEHYYQGLGMFTRTGVPKSVFYTFVMMNELRNMHRVPLEFSSEPYDGIAAIGDNGEIKVLLTTFCEEKLNVDETATVKVEVPWLKRSRPMVKVSRIDSSNDTRLAYEKLGRPSVKDISGNDLAAKINEMCAPKAVDYDNFTVEKGVLTITLPMELNSVALVDIQ